MSQELTEPSRKLPLDGARVLVVEDEYYIADDVQRELKAAGADVVGPVGTVAMAQKAIDDDCFDCAVLDLNLHGESALPVADRLVERGKSFAIATGYGSGAVPDKFGGVPRIEKPFDPPALLELVSKLSCARSDAAG
jgi:DNA-binding response OmpR family regulator